MSTVRTIRLPDDLEEALRKRDMNFTKLCITLLWALVNKEIDIGPIPKPRTSKNRKTLLRQKKLLNL